MNQTILEMKQVCKRFGGTVALDKMRLTVKTHEVLVLVGENGAGKSTLMKIMSGVYQPDSGEIVMDGKPVRIGKPADARALGINLIYQELSVAPNLTVAQNIFMGSEPRNRFGLIDQRSANTRSAEVLALLGSRILPTTLAGTLSIADQQQVEIARALIHKSRILIMDEPTAALSDRETERLFGVIEKLRAEGIAIVYISHRMAEVTRLADRVTVLRDGTYVGDLERGAIDPERVIQMMVGRALGDFYQSRAGHRPSGAARLRVENLGGGRVKPASFEVHAGEVVGFAGLVGAGRTELARLIFGADQRSSGEIFLDGVAARIRHPLDAIRFGIGYVPEDRKGQGLFLQMSVQDNATLNVLGSSARLGMLNGRALRGGADSAISRLAIKVRDGSGMVGALSGGNQQKVLLARWLAIGPRILILDEPTRGVDVGAKAEIYRIIHQLAQDGVAVIVISSELPEIIGLCDRVMVMREGHLVGTLQGNGISQEAIMMLATHISEPERKPPEAQAA